MRRGNINNSNNFGRDILLQVLKQAREYHREGLQVIPLNPPERPPKWFTKNAVKWSKVPLWRRGKGLYKWKTDDYSFVEVAKLIKLHFDKTGKLCNIGVRGYCVVDFDNLTLNDIKNLKDKDVRDILFLAPDL